MTITATKLDAVRGDTNVWTFAVGDLDSYTSLTFQVQLQSGAILATKTLGNGIDTDDEGVAVMLAPADTSVLEPVLHVLTYNLRGITSSGSVTTLYQGSLYVFTDVVMP